MSELYIVDSTDGTVKIGITPGGYNGPGGVVTDSDLRLYGAGHRKWGEGVDENFYRILENFSCDAKVLNDFNPNTSLNDFDPLIDGIVPKDDQDLGTGFGITNPLAGQIWFNSSINKILVYNGIRWKFISGTTTGGTAPVNPVVGDFWYDDTVPQLNIWNGASWVSVADRYVLKSGDTMTGILTLSGNPTLPLHAVPKQFLDTTIANLGITYYDKTESDNRFVNITGDTMTGFLTLNANPTANLHAATKQYVDSGDATLAASISGLSTLYYNKTESDNRFVHLTGNETITGVKSFVNQITSTLTSGAPFIINSTTKVANLNADLLDNQTSAYYAVNSAVVHLTGNESISGTKTFTSETRNYIGSGHGQIRLVAGSGQPALILRNDGGRSYFLLTPSGGGGTELGTWTTERPLSIDDDGQTLYSSAELLMQHASRTITLSKDPTSAMHAVTKQYVDALAAGVVTGITATYSNNTNGYIKFSNGFTLQWGRYFHNAATYYGTQTFDITFPIAFTTARFAMCGLGNSYDFELGDPGFITAANNQYGCWIQTNSTLRVRTTLGITNHYDWIAIGHI